MAHHKTSMDALRELLLFPSNLSHNNCSVTKIPQNVTKLSDGSDYCLCLVEITCDNSIQYGLQAFGAEAMKLHKEATWCHMLQKGNEKREEKKGLSRTERRLLFTVLADVIQNSTIHFVAV
jgi:hypothetical protein